MEKSKDEIIIDICKGVDGIPMNVAVLIWDAAIEMAAEKAYSTEQLQSILQLKFKK